MASQNPEPNHKTVFGSIYCADPNCEYCKGLRATIEQLRDKGYIPLPPKSGQRSTCLTLRTPRIFPLAVQQIAERLKTA
jgi:hypothetical protein